MGGHNKMEAAPASSEIGCCGEAETAGSATEPVGGAGAAGVEEACAPATGVAGSLPLGASLDDPELFGW